MFQLMVCNVAVLSIAALYYAWRDSRVVETKRRAVLNDRVAYMLWVAAQRAA